MSWIGFEERDFKIQKRGQNSDTLFAFIRHKEYGIYENRRHSMASDEKANQKRIT